MRKFGMILLLGFSLSFAVNAQEVITSKSNMAGLKSPFKTDFKLFFDSENSALSKVTQLIEEGRKKKNVETLLSASFILFLEEKNSGKSAELTGLNILKEATQIAIRSKDKDKIALVAKYWGDPFCGNNAAYAEELVYNE
ncbi:MAG: hypothetical protein IT278_04860 [Ignavibacteriaceae bacterium]|nr:hypothetical protein [Ignavibacteriaceae bacterium]